MKASVYEVLRTTESTHWFCDDCQERAMTAVVTDKSIRETLKKYMSGMTVRVEAVEGKLETKANIDDLEAMTIKIEKLEKKIEDTVEQPHEAIAPISISEIEQRQKRRDNIVVLGLNEPDADTAEDRENQDSQAVQEMLEKIEAVSKIKDPIRIGKKGGKPRPVRVTVPDQSERKKILSKASTLAKVKELSKKVYIKRDITQREQQELKKLVEERDSKRREATEKWNEMNRALGHLCSHIG